MKVRLGPMAHNHKSVEKNVKEILFSFEFFFLRGKIVGIKYQ